MHPVCNYVIMLCHIVFHVFTVACVIELLVLLSFGIMAASGVILFYSVSI